MRARFNPKAIEELNAFDRFVKQKEEIQKIITDNKDKKIFLEIGMGKGDFITQMATLDRENIYIGVEVSPPILALAVKKLKRYERPFLRNISYPILFKKIRLTIISFISL